MKRDILLVLLGIVLGIGLAGFAAQATVYEKLDLVHAQFIDAMEHDEYLRVVKSRGNVVFNDLGNPNFTLEFTGSKFIGEALHGLLYEVPVINGEVEMILNGEKSKIPVDVDKFSFEGVIVLSQLYDIDNSIHLCVIKEEIRDWESNRSWPSECLVELGHEARAD